MNPKQIKMMTATLRRSYVKGGSVIAENRTMSLRAIATVAMGCLIVISTARGEVSVLNTSSDLSGGAGLVVSAIDLVNQGQATFLSYTEGTPTFGAGTANEGTATNLTTSGTFYRSTQLPATLVFNLDVSTNTAGYDITQIDSFAGWQGGGTQTYANQNFTVEYSVVGMGIGNGELGMGNNGKPVSRHSHSSRSYHSHHSHSSYHWGAGA